MNDSRGLSTHHYIRSVTMSEDVDSQRYPFSIASVLALPTLSFDQSVTFLVGENGSGKSTIIESLAVAAGYNAEGGTRNNSFSTRDTTSPLVDKIRLVRGIKKPRTGYFLRAESFYNVATEVERLDEDPSGGALVGQTYGDVALHHQSHGEAFLAVVKHKFGPNGLYILDEPESALSPERQLSLLMRMNQLVSEGSQFIIATHSPILLAYPDATIYELDGHGARKTAYEDTAHYKFTTDFLNNHIAYTRRLSSE